MIKLGPVQLLNIIVYKGPISMKKLVEETGKDEKKLEETLKSLKERKLVRDLGNGIFDIDTSILSIIIQRNVSERNLKEIVGRRLPQYEEYLEIIGKLNELKQRILGEKEIPKFKFIRLPVEIEAKSVEDALEDAILNLLTELIFNIPSTDPKDIIDILKETNGRVEEDVHQMLRKFYKDVSRQKRLLEKILRKLRKG